MRVAWKVAKNAQKWRCLSTSVDTNNKLAKMCIVGSGPASFYAAQRLLKLLPQVQIDIFERLPVPFGLVRFGVAPDHPEVKNAINSFTKSAHDPRLRFVGNVSLGKDISLKELQDAYHSVLLAYGAEEDRKLGIPGENISSVLSAREFVGWYNGLPANKNLNVNLDVETVAIIGQGNVALDIARILLTPIDLLKKTDITEYSLATLSKSRVKKVFLIGRRGPLQVAFSIKEFREMLRIPKCITLMNTADFIGLEEIIPTLKRPRQRLTDLLLKTALKPVEDGDRHFQPIFFRTPKSIISENDNTSTIKGITLAINKMEGDRAVETSTSEFLQCDLALRSIGYKSVRADENIPFNFEKGYVINDDGTVRPGLYVSGWLATGPMGVILSTMNNAFAVGETMVSHILNNTVNADESRPGYELIGSLLKSRGIQTVSFQDWERIDKVELERGKAAGKLREKIVSIAEMLSIASENK